MKEKLIIMLALLLAFTVDAIPPTAPAISYTNPQTYIVGMAITDLTPANSGGEVPATVPGTVITLAGSGTNGSNNGIGTAASFGSPAGVAVDGSGNVYAADLTNNMIRKITADGVVSTLAGSGSDGSANGTGNAASFYYPSGVAVDGSGNVYVADGDNNMIRKITAAGVVTTLAGKDPNDPGSEDGMGTAASFFSPSGVAVDGAGNVYVADRNNNMIRKITANGVVSTLAGRNYEFYDDSGTLTHFFLPSGIAVDGSGNVYVADTYHNMIRKITDDGVVSTLAGSTTSGHADSTGTAARFSCPIGVAVDDSGNVYVGDKFNNLIRKITAAGVVSTIAGDRSYGSTDGIGTAASFKFPMGMAVDGSGNVYVGDAGNYKIRKIIHTGYYICPALPAGLSFNAATGTISGTSTATSAATDYTIMAINGGGCSRATINITVVIPVACTITTQAVNIITTTTATGNGNITDLGAPNPTAYGVCWNTTGTPTIADSKTDQGAASATGAFTTLMTSLTASTTYYVKAYAINTAGISYGNEISFATLTTTPVANAGIDQTVDEGTTVTLDGSASSDADNDPLTYKWTAPEGITLNSMTVVNPTFIAPEVKSNTQYIFSLVVNDGTVNSPANYVIIYVRQINKAPIANAGADQTVNEGALVTLDGTASSDPDGITLYYTWTDPEGISLNSTTADKPTFGAPEVTADTQYTFSLVVNDGITDSPVDQVVITIKNVVGFDPIVNDEDVQIYLIPSKDKVYIKFNQEPQVGTSISVYDVLGKVVLKSIADRKEVLLNLSGNPAGLYFIRIDQQDLKTYKVVLK